ncbi:MAG: multiple antibiotic resistance protein [Elusimicrobia bacterium]|nr:MAG: multiple antibiotic resistance protein [Elusimicrobiota bacterium]KAF0158050.1 MAG: multiple antibiotic resistance protein [Elusimicrobiota bacterium]
MDILPFASAVFTLALVMDPLGNIPMFMSALKSVPEPRRRPVIIRELFIALGLMVFFLLFGKYIVSFLAIDLTAMSVAGGIVLFLIALQMIFPRGDSHFADNPGGEPFIVPLAIPLVAGPSVLTMVLLFSLQEPGRLGTWFGVVGAAWLINAVILGGLAGPLSRLLGERGLLAMEKLMGMILITISVQMIMTGLKKFLAA